MSELRHVNPSTTYDSLSTRGYSQVVVVPRQSALVYVSGQLPLDTEGKVVGKDIESQTRAVFENMRLSLESVGLSMDNVIKLNAYVTDIETQPAYIRKIRSRYFKSETPPASTMIEVRRFAHPDILLEIDAVAAV